MFFPAACNELGEMLNTVLLQCCGIWNLGRNSPWNKRCAVSRAARWKIARTFLLSVYLDRSRHLSALCNIRFARTVKGQPVAPQGLVKSLVDPGRQSSFDIYFPPLPLVAHPPAPLGPARDNEVIRWNCFADVIAFIKTVITIAIRVFYLWKLVNFVAILNAAVAVIFIISYTIFKRVNGL